MTHPEASNVPASSRSGSGRPLDGAPVPAAGVILFSRYRVLRELGRGGMGVVLLAHDLELGVDVAIKLIPDLLVQDHEALDELKHEVLRGVALTHPGIVRTHGFVRDEATGGIVMEYVDGGHFTDLKRLQAGGCFDAADLLPWVEQLAPVLDYAHFEIGIAHRDLKPRNLMYTLAGRIKVADFGISSSLHDSVTRVTVQGSSSGTPAYMSPQQVMGERPSHLDDVYALGATLYELLTGKPPFYRGQVLAQVLDSPPEPMAARREELGVTGKAAIPAEWEAAVAACLAKEPSQRPQSASELLERVKSAVTGSRIPEASAADVSIDPPARARGRRRGQGGRVVVAIVAVVTMLAGGWGFMESRKPSRGAAAADPPVPVDPLRIMSPAELPSGVEGEPYLVRLNAGGGSRPYAWSVDSGALPDGLTVDGARGWVEGIPVAAGESGWVTRVRDGADAAASQAMRMVIHPRPSPPEPELVPLLGPAFMPILGPKPPPAPVVEEKPPWPPMIRAPFENSLGMRFVDSGTPDVVMSVWLTRVRDFRAFVEATGHNAKRDVYSILMGGDPKFGLHRHDWSDPGFPQGDDHPVCGISWEDAKAFCKWLSAAEFAEGRIPAGFEYRLPSADEWRRALALKAVGGNLPNYPWGDQWPPPLAVAAWCNLAGQELNDGEMPAGWVYLDGFRDAFPRTSPVDVFQGNELGIKDLVGNLSQFCENPGGPGNQSRQIVGGSWCFSGRKALEVDAATFRAADLRAVDSGFRCVLVRK